MYLRVVNETSGAAKHLETYLTTMLAEMLNYIPFQMEHRITYRAKIVIVSFVMR